MELDNWLPAWVKHSWLVSWAWGRRQLPLAAFLFSSATATAWVGFLFGWFTGASLSPIAGTVAPLVFGLLTMLGLGTAILSSRSLGPALEKLQSFQALNEGQKLAIRSEIGHQPSYWHLAFSAVVVWVFCTFCLRGLAWGIRHRDRTPPVAVTLTDSSEARSQD